uniref:Ig-like domain-containing protein n=1 Tax=Gallus gallus TaxID=9031 RepID=A0A8V0YZS7_CHICK
MVAGSPALLLLLSLGLCCTSAQGHRYAMAVRFLNRSMKHPKEGQRLELECVNYNSDNGVFWIRLDKDENLHFIVYISKYSWTTFSGNKGASSQFEGSKQGSSYQLVVKNFSARDQGIYFCIANIHPMLHFSTGQRAFFPVTTKAAPTTLATTTPSSQVTKKDNSQQSPDAGTNSKNTLHFCYDVVMRVNLAGACLLLLTAITITITHCQSWINISQSILHSQTITENLETSFHQTVLPLPSRNT